MFVESVYIIHLFSGNFAGVSRFRDLGSGNTLEWLQRNLCSMDLYAVKSRMFALIRWKGSTNNRHVRIVLMTVTGVHGYN